MATTPPASLEAVLRGIDLQGSGASPATLQSVVNLAIEIAREGREGRKIGTLFTVGAEDSVLERSRSLILDPLVGHPIERRWIVDPNLRETLKELAQLDGGFVISHDGYALSACRYFESAMQPGPHNLGLGTRHMAAASISATTEAIAVVVSESSIVRLYADGELLTEILPELWLIHRYMSHIDDPLLTADQTHNLGILRERHTTRAGRSGSSTEH
jgi:DNA integrity scanning protein DisA with diadenylate cyclase activity